jgi:hypothetical protein
MGTSSFITKMGIPHFVHSSVVGYVGRFHLLAIMNNNAMNTAVQVMQTCFHSSWVYTFLGVELLGHIVTAYLTCADSQSVFQVAIPFSISTGYISVPISLGTFLKSYSFL